jgi:hypothetical protein
MTHARAACLLALGAALLSGGRVQAAEGELLLAAGGAYAGARADGRWAHGGQLQVEGQYGLDDAWSVRAGLELGLHGTEADGVRPGGRARRTAVAAGVVYALDVLRVVPYAQLGLAVQNLGGAVSDARTDGGFDLALGADYLIDRRWALGLVLRAQLFPLPLGGERGHFGGTPSVLAAGLRLARGF